MLLLPLLLLLPFPLAEEETDELCLAEPRGCDPESLTLRPGFDEEVEEEVEMEEEFPPTTPDTKRGFEELLDEEFVDPKRLCEVDVARRLLAEEEDDDDPGSPAAGPSVSPSDWIPTQ